MRTGIEIEVTSEDSQRLEAIVAARFTAKACLAHPDHFADGSGKGDHGRDRQIQDLRLASAGEQRRDSRARGYDFAPLRPIGKALASEVTLRTFIQIPC